MKTLVHSVIKYLFILLLGAALVFGLWFWGSLKYVYSTGERAGYIQKFSKRGWLIKTWEGELAMVNLPGAMPEIFSFSVVDHAVAAQVNQTMGKRIVITYDQHRYIPLPIFAETEYFATGVKEVSSAPVN